VSASGPQPVPRQQIRRLRRVAYAHPRPGDQPLLDPRHKLDTTARTEPGRLTRIIFSLDVGYHVSGWFANSDYECCLHLSVSHPVPDQLEVVRAPAPLPEGQMRRMRLEAPTEAEVRVWGRLFFRDHDRLCWYEPPVGPLDPYRSPGVAHLRLFLDRANRPIMPRGEVYHLRPWDDGSSPAKITEGRAGGDVR